MAQITSRISQRALAADKSNAAVADFYFNSRYGTQHGDGGIADFTFGKPHEMPLRGLVTGFDTRGGTQRQDMPTSRAKRSRKLSLRSGMPRTWLALRT